MIKLYICCSVLSIESVEMGPDMDMKFHQDVMEIVNYDTKIRFHTKIKPDPKIKFHTKIKSDLKIRFHSKVACIQNFELILNIILEHPKPSTSSLKQPGRLAGCYLE